MIDNVGEEENESRETSGHDVQKSGQEEKSGTNGLKPAAAMADKPVQRASLKEKLETYKAQAAGTGKPNIEKAKGKEEAL